MLDKIKGGLFGVAIGDALGGTTEFLDKGQIRKKYGQVREIIGGGCWGLEKGETTDDTAMTLAVARGIIANPSDPIDSIGNEFMKWKKTNPKDIGNIIATVFGIFDGDWFAAAEEAHFKWLNKMSAGNGTLMRCLPVALAYKEIGKVEDITRAQSKMTHHYGLADEACIIYNRIASNVLLGKNLKETIREEVSGTRYEKISNGAKPECEQSGYVVDTMEWVLYWLLSSDSFTDVITGAANEGYDTDTVAAIAGGLAGLSWGYEALPAKYTDCLLQKDEISGISAELFRIRETNQ